MFEPLTVLLVVGTFLLAGTVKGVIGLGLPLVSLAFLTVAFDLRTAMVLTLVPSFITNLWQAVAGGSAKIILSRLWPFLLMATVTVWIGVHALANLNPTLPTGILGALLVTYAVLNLGGVRFAVPHKHEAWAGPLIGITNGVLTGMTGTSVVPGVMFLQAIGLPRDVLIQSMGMLFTASTIALAIALQRSNFLNLDQAILSASAIVPAVIGMLGGQALRKRLSEQRFRTVFFFTLFLLGAYIIAKA
jgi:uncharacterized membrane protein YfcA